MKERVKWLDSSRGLCFLAVIYNHIEFSDPDVMAFLSPFFLTVFFFVSGYLFKGGKGFLEVFEQRTRGLYIPFLIYGSLLVVSQYVYSTHEVEEPLPQALVSLWLQDGRNNMIWFIPALYVYSLAFYWIDRWCASSRALVAASLACALANWAAVYIGGLGYVPFTLQAMGYGIFWMGLGRVFCIEKERLGKYICVKGFVVALPVYILPIAIAGRTYVFWASEYFIDWLIVVSASVYCVIYLSQTILIRSRFLLFVGANTLLYFILHGKVYAVLEAIGKKYFSSMPDGGPAFDLIGLAEVAVVALVLIIPVMIINKYLPWTIGKGYRLWRSHSKD